MRLFERKRQEFAMRHEYEKLQKAKTAGKNSKNSSTLASNSDTNRSKSPKRMVIRVGRDEYKPEPLELHHISEDEMSNSPPPSKRSKKSAYEEWKAEKGLDSEEPVKKSDKKRIEELENRNQELERELEDSKKRYREQITCVHNLQHQSMCYAVGAPITTSRQTLEVKLGEKSIEEKAQRFSERMIECLKLELPESETTSDRVTRSGRSLPFSYDPATKKNFISRLFVYKNLIIQKRRKVKFNAQTVKRQISAIRIAINKKIRQQNERKAADEAKNKKNQRKRKRTISV